METSSAPPPPRIAPPPKVLTRPRLFVLAVLGALWAVGAQALGGRAARGITDRFDVDVARGLLGGLFTVFLLMVGYRLLAAGGDRGASFAGAAGLPRRATARREWALGAALGWGLGVVAVLPMALGGALHGRLWTEPRAFGLALLSVATLMVTALASEMVLRGYPFRCLVGAVGPVWATLLLIGGLGVACWVEGAAGSAGVWVTMLLGMLLAMAWLRTHGLWLGWGLHFAWSASLAVLFGLPLRGVSDFATVVETRGLGPMWLTGGAFGPEGAVLTAVGLVAGLVVLVRATDEYAWAYTRREIVAAGYEVNPAPPAAHEAMEASAKAPVLVQILPTTPQSRSVELP